MRKMASIKFIRANGLGNDFLIYDKTNSTSSEIDKLFSKENIIKFSSRQNKNTSGCDQLILLDFSNKDEVFMTIYNSDGSEVYACGNATRCVVALNDVKFAIKETEVKTKSDSLKGKVFQKLDEANFMVSVNMNKPITDWQKIPLSKNLDYKNIPIELAGFENPFAVSMGNPHMVFTTTKNIAEMDIPKIAAPLEHHEFFPQRVNVGFAQIIDRDNINLRVFERGAGETLACGTGACAAGFAVMERGLTNKKINVDTRGGKMIIELNQAGEIIMTGPAQFEKEVTDSIKMKKIAIIGTGISGLSAAYFLNNAGYDIKVFEQNNYIGGHSNTADINYDGHDISVDTGFIVYNDWNYPNLNKLFDKIGVNGVKSNMTFAASVDNGALEYCGSGLNGLFAQRKNLLNLNFILMIKDILKFNKQAPKILDTENNETLEQFLNRHKLREYFRNYYLLPMAAAIWSCPKETMLKYPAQNFIRFFKNHGLLNVKNRPQWYTIPGGSKNYVAKLCTDFRHKIFLNSKVVEVKRASGGVIVKLEDGTEESFDEAVLACHGDQTFKMISDLNALESDILKNFRYQKNRAVLHRDKNLMPKNKKTWSSWNYIKVGEDFSDDIFLTYWMNSLQPINKKHPIFVSLNPKIEPIDKLIFAEYEYHHPIFDEASVASQQRICEIQGVNKLWYCGAYQRYGFHEDGLLSAVNMFRKFTGNESWEIEQ